MYTLRCGDGSSCGCGETEQVDQLGVSTKKFCFETFNSGFYICNNGCDDANVDILNENGVEIDLDENPVLEQQAALNALLDEGEEF
jgi:hypothetical protein